MMEAARTSETLVNFYQTTRCYNPEDSNLRTDRRENLKSYLTETTSKHSANGRRISRLLPKRVCTYQRERSGLLRTCEGRGKDLRKANVVYEERKKTLYICYFSCSETKKWREQFLSGKWSIVDEEADYRGMINCTNTV
jgi:hypothetical protein